MAIVNWSINKPPIYFLLVQQKWDVSLLIYIIHVNVYLTTSIGIFPLPSFSCPKPVPNLMQPIYLPNNLHMKCHYLLIIMSKSISQTKFMSSDILTCIIYLRCLVKKLELHYYLTNSHKIILQLLPQHQCIRTIVTIFDKHIRYSPK